MTNHWGDDLLNRRTESEFLYNYIMGKVDRPRLDGRTGSLSINIDSEWGGGKSFFLDRFALDVEKQGHLVVRVNAWRDDYAADAYIAIMAALERALSPLLPKQSKLETAWNATKKHGGPIALRTLSEVGKGALKKLGGIEVDALLSALDVDDIPGDSITSDAIKTGNEAIITNVGKLFDRSLENLIEGFNKTDKATESFRARLEYLISVSEFEVKLPIFFIVDELDRCKPTYAVQLLERIKHLFDVKGIVFVFATNSNQLRHSVSAFYGNQFDGFRYLRRFFDSTYVLAKPDMNLLVTGMSERLAKDKIHFPGKDLGAVLTAGFNAYELQARDIIQAMDLIDSVVSAWNHRAKIEITLLLPACANFILNGNSNWSPIPNHNIGMWSVDVPDPATSNDRYKTMIAFNFSQVYLNVVNIFRNMDSVVKETSNRRGDIIQSYVHELFLPEWSNQTVTSAPSIQTNIPRLVASAGRISLG